MPKYALAISIITGLVFWITVGIVLQSFWIGFFTYTIIGCITFLICVLVMPKAEESEN